MASKWTYETVETESRKYTTRTEFARGSSGAYNWAWQNKVLDDFTWLVDGREAASEKRRKWTKEPTETEARKYSTRKQFAKGSPGAYAAALENGWIDEYDFFIDGNKANGEKKRIWNDETSMEAAKKCSSRTEFARTYPSAYARLLENGKIDECYWFEDGVKRSAEERLYWNEERCREASLNCKSKYEFKSKYPSAYSSARTHGWLGSFVWLNKVKPEEYWTYDRCYEEAMKYKSNAEFFKYSQTCYKIVVKNKWLHTFTWLTIKKYPKGYWTYELCAEISKNYSTIQEYKEGSSSSFNQAKKQGWLKDFSWLRDERFDLLKGKVDSVYAYEFDDNHVYVGRTLMRRQKIRDFEHFFDENDPVRLHAIELGGNVIPKMKILEDNLTLEEGHDREGYWLDWYVSQGWIKLNRIKTGSMGGLTFRKWNVDTCFERAMNFTTMKEFRNMEPSCYRVAKELCILDEFDWLEKDTVKPNKYWTVERSIEAAKPYGTRKEFQRACPTAYENLRKLNLLDKCYWFKPVPESVKHHHEPWTIETCIEKMKEFSTLKEFRESAKGAYKFALEHDLIDKYFDRQIKPAGYWDFEHCQEAAIETGSRGKMAWEYYTAYDTSRRNGWLDIFFPKD